jgi:phage baseplate assembly protein W
MPRQSRKYSDIDLTFKPHPVSGDINILRDVEAVKRSVHNLMMMGFYERPFEPDLGANLKQLLFEPINPLTEVSIRQQIMSAIARYEPRVSVTKLVVIGSPDLNKYEVQLTFVIDSLSEIVKIDTFLEKIR